MQSRKREPGLIRHLEKSLGPISGGWDATPDGNQLPFTVAEFASTHFSGCRGYATIRVSNVPLTNATTGSTVRQERVAIARAKTTILPSLLQNVGSSMVNERRAILRGDIVSNCGPISEGSLLDSLYATAPVYFADEFSVAKLGSGVSCYIVWLVPISASERDYVRSHGWEAFEEILVNEDPDLLSLDRSTVAGAH